MSTEDERVAAGISITISSQLIAAALAMLTIEGAIVAFVYGARETGPIFLWLLIGAAVSFVLSIYKGGLGMDSVRAAGHDGNWDKTQGQSGFNWQAKLCVLGLILFFACSFCIGPPIRDDSQAQIDAINQRLTQLANIEKSQASQPPAVPIQCPAKKVMTHKPKC